MILEHVTGPKEAAAYLAKHIETQLYLGKQVLWFVPGGSGIAVAVAAARALAASPVPLSALTVTLTDERYGPVGHSDSNFATLTKAGFTLTGATMLPVLTGESQVETVRTFTKTLEGALAVSTERVGLFGIGADGHTAGILPRSSAAVSDELVATYSAGVFKRITITPKVIKMLNETISYALGESKWQTIAALLATGATIASQPAQALKQVPRAVLFSDYQDI